MLIRLKKAIPSLLSIIFCFALFLSCNKNINDEQAADTKPDLLAKTFSSVSGFVTDENHAAVKGAAVKVGTAAPSVLTDEYGYFEVKDVEVNKIAATVTVSKPGYFKGFKTWAVTADKAAFFRIKLIPKTIAGTISTSSGGNVSLSNGLIIALPSNGVVKASDNSAYTGNIHVAVSWLDPEANDLTEIMPGDLRGIDDAGAMKGLTTFGMAAVELANDAGELLQIAAGKKATITMPLSSVLAAAAPSTIPLWYFDESIGLWKEEGAASKTGNTYTGEVSHFSFWNCDMPNAIVPLTFNVVDNNGNPIQNAHIEITPTTPGSWSHTGGYTDGTGYVSVFITPNTSYKLEIYSGCNYYGDTPDYSQAFSVTTTAVDLGNIIIPAVSIANISGTITDCAGNRVTHGDIIIQTDQYCTRYPVDNTGSYNFSLILCAGTTTVNLIARDIAKMQQSNPVVHTIVVGTNSIGNIQACGSIVSEFINYTLNGGALISFTAPIDSVFQADTIYYPNSIYIWGWRHPTASQWVELVFDKTGITVGSSQTLTFFNIPTVSIGVPAITTPVNITEYGPIGGYIAGNFSGIIDPPNAVSCSFRVKRVY